MKNETYALRPLVADVRDGYRGMRAIRTSLKSSKREVMRAARAERKALRHDLASYTTPRDLDDLEAILARYSEHETAGIRRLIAGRR